MTGCFVGWRTYQQETLPRLITQENGNSVCVNSITWTISTTLADKTQNAGSLFGFNTLIPQVVGASIEPTSKILWVTLPEKAGERLQKMKNLHTFDYNLFWMSIRNNVKDRVDAYLATHKD